MFSPAISPIDPKLMMINCDMSAAYISSDGGHNWRMIHYSQLRTSTVCRPAFHPADPHTIYAANGWAGGLSISKDTGVTWKAIGNLPGNLTGEIAINPSSPEHMLAGAGGEVWRSDDSGTTWTRCDGPSGQPLSFHFDQIAPGTWFAATVQGVWRSQDGGKTWERKASGLPAGAILAFAGGSNAKDGCILYVTVPGKLQDGKYVGGIYRSDDRGESWQSINGQGLNLETKPFDEWPMDNIAQYSQIVTTNLKPRTVYAFGSGTGVPPPHNASIYRSDDAGASWRATFQADPRWQPMNVQQDYMVSADGQYYQEKPRVTICATDPERLLVVAGRAYTTVDGGATWQLADTEQVPAAPDQPRRWICNGLVVTTTWNYYIDPFQPNHHYISYTDLGFARSQDQGKTWEWWALKGRAPWVNTCYELAFDPEIPGKMWGAFSNVHDIPNDNIISGRHGNNGPGGVCLSTDFAATWTAAKQGLPVCATTAVVVDPRSPKGNRTLYAGQFGKGVFKSTDDGRTWTAMNQGLSTAGNLRVCRVVLHNDGTLFALTTALRRDREFTKEGVGLYRSSDAGDNWTLVNASRPLLWPKDFTVDPANSNVIYIGAANAGDDTQGGLWRTTDGGTTWNCILKKGPEHFGAYLHPKHPGWIYATLTESDPGAGLWLSKDNGATWSAMSGLPFGNAQRVAFDPADPQTIYVTTFGGSIWKGPAQE